MSFIVFLLLFVVLCGWLDARVRVASPSERTKGEK